MVDGDLGAGAEAAGRAEADGDAADNHIDLAGGNVVKLGKAATSATDSAEGVGLVEDEPVFVLVLELNLGEGEPNDTDTDL